MFRAFCNRLTDLGYVAVDLRGSYMVVANRDASADRVDRHLCQQAKNTEAIFGMLIVMDVLWVESERKRQDLLCTHFFAKNRHAVK